MRRLPHHRLIIKLLRACVGLPRSREPTHAQSSAAATWERSPKTVNEPISGLFRSSRVVATTNAAALRCQQHAVRHCQTCRSLGQGCSHVMPLFNWPASLRVNASGRRYHSKDQSAAADAAHHLVAALALYFPVVSDFLLSSA